MTHNTLPQTKTFLKNTILKMIYRNATMILQTKPDTEVFSDIRNVQVVFGLCHEHRLGRTNHGRAKSACGIS